MHCINDTVILIRADKLGGQLAPVLPLSWPCQPANLRPLQETATTLATISVLYPAQAAPAPLKPGHHSQEEQTNLLTSDETRGWSFCEGDFQKISFSTHKE